MNEIAHLRDALAAMTKRAERARGWATQWHARVRDYRLRLRQAKATAAALTDLAADGAAYRRQADAAVASALRAEVERDVARRDAAALRAQLDFSTPLGDNHHNAAACPYCSPKHAARSASRCRNARCERTPQPGSVWLCATCASQLEARLVEIEARAASFRNAVLRAIDGWTLTHSGLTHGAQIRALVEDFDAQTATLLLAGD